MPYPIKYHNKAAKKISSMFLMRMFFVFLALTLPISSIAKPVCMNITRYVHINIHMVSNSFLDVNRCPFNKSISLMICSSGVAKSEF